MVSIIVTAFGEPGNRYAQFTARWWAAVLSMLPAPAEVVVAHTCPEPLGLLPGPATVRTVAVPCVKPDVVSMVNAAVEAATQPWVSVIGVDDCYTPTALTDLVKADAAGAEILVWHQREVGSHVWNCYWNPDVLQRANTLAGSCPVRRDLWLRVGGPPRIAWSDWGFWLRCAKAGATAYQSDVVGVDFDAGRGHATFSGSATFEQLAARDAEARAFAMELFL
jgi:hypothetical protein